MSGLLPPPLPDAVAAPGPVARATTRRDELIIGGVIAAALVLATIASARIVADDLREGPLWAVAGALRGINLAAAIACILLSVLASVKVVRKMSGFGAWSKGFVAAAVTAICMLPALLTVDESLDESVLFVTPAVMVVPAVLAAAVTVIAARWHRARTLLLLAAAVVAAWPIATAAAYVDNTDHPVPAALAAAIFLLLLALSVTARIRAGVVDQLIRAVVVAAHALGLVFVISAATSCVDDDCIPVPLWYLCGALALVWVAAADSLPRRPSTVSAETGPDPDPAPATRHPFVAAGGWAFAAPLGFLVVAALIVVPVDPRRSPPTFDMVEPETIRDLPSMLAWDDREGCVLIAGVGDLTVFRQTCRSEFVEWIEPSPLLVVSDPRRKRSVFDPITFDLSPRSWDFVPNVVEPPSALRLETLDRGRVEAWVDKPDGESRRLIAAQGGYTYALREGGISADGSLAAVVDTASRLLLVPTDGSRDAVVLDSNVRRFGGWQPAFGPGVTEFALERKVPLRIPQGVENEQDFYEAHRELEAVLDLTVSADLVVVGDEVHVRLTGAPSAADFPHGYCLAVTSFFESSAASRTYRSVDIGGRVAFCDASTQQLDAACSTPTVPTAATVDDLERFEVLVIEAELIAPRSDDLVPGEFAYYQLTTDQVTGGAINPDRLPRPDDTCS